MKLISADQTGASGFHAPMEFEFRSGSLAAVFLPIKIGTKAATNPLLERVPLLNYYQFLLSDRYRFLEYSSVRMIGKF